MLHVYSMDFKITVQSNMNDISHFRLVQRYKSLAQGRSARRHRVVLNL